MACDGKTGGDKESIIEQQENHTGSNLVLNINGCVPITQSTRGKKKNKSRRQKLVINVCNSKYDVIRDVCKDKYKMKLIEDEQPPSGTQQPGLEEFDIYWSDVAQGPDRLLRLRPY